MQCMWAMLDERAVIVCGVWYVVIVCGVWYVVIVCGVWCVVCDEYNE